MGSKKSRTMMNNNLGGNQIIYTEKKKEIKGKINNLNKQYEK